ncbi:MAG TPA: cysteine peptidase family C39 domain-containing protein [Chitinophagaceae bacterium]
MRFPLFYQSDFNDCGPTSLKMIAAYYGQHYELDFLIKKCKLKAEGASMLNIHRTAKEMGFYSKGLKLHLERLNEIKHPVILHCGKTHFSVIYKTPKANRKGVYYIADPARGLLKLTEKEFIPYWAGASTKDLSLTMLPLVHILFVAPKKKELIKTGQLFV